MLYLDVQRNAIYFHLLQWVTKNKRTEKSAVFGDAPFLCHPQSMPSPLPLHHQLYQVCVYAREAVSHQSVEAIKQLDGIRIILKSLSLST
jgi:hypothetical protein